MANLFKANVGFSAGWTSAMAVSLVTSVVLFPHHVEQPELYGLSYLAIEGALKGAGLPLVILWLISFLRRPVSAHTGFLISAVVALPLVSWKLWIVWDHYGAFPDWLPQKQLLILLPTALVAGYVFGIVANRVTPGASIDAMEPKPNHD
ncbi:hypothetical protein V1318_18880 [Lysobacter sp. CCNWLW3]|uniref:hypothetical protein n=1 Tax=unclassified Lysobacter TaxID=2635362 RepID=UPI002FD5F233